MYVVGWLWWEIYVEVCVIVLVGGDELLDDVWCMCECGVLWYCIVIGEGLV